MPDWTNVLTELGNVADPETENTLSVEKTQVILEVFGADVTTLDGPLGAYDPFGLVVDALEATTAALPDTDAVWDFLIDIARRLDWETTAVVPLADVMARWLVRTHVEAGVAAIPRGALVHIGGPSVSLGTDVPAPRYRGYYGWGTGHAKEPVRDNVVAAAQAGQNVFVIQTLVHAFYANQSQAIRTYEEVMDYCRTIDLDRLQAALATLSTPADLPAVIRGPPGWLPTEATDRPFSWDERILERLRSATPEGVVGPDIPQPTLE